MFPNSLPTYIFLIAKHAKDTTRKVNWIQYPLLTYIDAVILNGIFANQIQQYKKCVIYHDQIFSRMQDWLDIQKSV